MTSMTNLVGGWHGGLGSCSSDNALGGDDDAFDNDSTMRPSIGWDVDVTFHHAYTTTCDSSRYGSDDVDAMARVVSSSLIDDDNGNNKRREIYDVEPCKSGTASTVTNDFVHMHDERGVIIASRWKGEKKLMPSSTSTPWHYSGKPLTPKGTGCYDSHLITDCTGVTTIPTVSNTTERTHNSREDDVVQSQECVDISSLPTHSSISSVLTVAQTHYDDAASCLTVLNDDRGTIDCDDDHSVEFGAIMNHEFDQLLTLSVGSDYILNINAPKRTNGGAVLGEMSGFSIPKYNLTANLIDEEIHQSVNQQEDEAFILQLALYAAAVFISVSTMILVAIIPLRLTINFSQGQGTRIMPSPIVWAYITLFACFTGNPYILGYEHGGFNQRVLRREIRGGAIYRIRGGLNGVLAENSDIPTKVIVDLLKLLIILTFYSQHVSFFVLLSLGEVQVMMLSLKHIRKRQLA
jgi:hypothetical protein